MATALRAYRRWALDHPAEFGLAYGTPVPGYRAPADRTIRAGARIGDYLNGLLVQAHEQGRLDQAAIEDRAASLPRPPPSSWSSCGNGVTTAAPPR